MARALPITVLLVDRPKLYRRCLGACLSHRRHVSIVGEADDPLAAIAAARRLQPQIVLVDTDIADSGPDLVLKLYRAAPHTAVVVLTLGNEHGVRQLLVAGARGCLRKDCEPEDVLRAMERVSAGELFLGRGVADVVFGNPDHAHVPTSPAQGLSDRKMEVLALVAAGATNREIARDLCITENTAKGHVRALLRDLGLDNRVQLATYALRTEVVEPLVRVGSATPLNQQ